MTLLLAACGPKPGGDTREAKAVSLVKKRLDRGVRLIKSQVASEPMPMELMADEFKQCRDIVFKAQLDYESCKTRGLRAGMDAAVSKIRKCQELIQAEVEKQRQSRDDKERLFVMATIKERSGRESSLVVVFDSETLEIERWIPVTTPVRNNAVMITNALSGRLLDVATTESADIADKTTSAVVKFILAATPK